MVQDVHTSDTKSSGNNIFYVQIFCKYTIYTVRQIRAFCCGCSHFPHRHILLAFLFWITLQRLLRYPLLCRMAIKDRGNIFCAQICLPIICVDMVRATRGEHWKSHLKNWHDCYHGAQICGVATECVHLIGFSRHSRAQWEEEKTINAGRGQGVIETVNNTLNKNNLRPMEYLHFNWYILQSIKPDSYFTKGMSY